MLKRQDEEIAELHEIQVINVERLQSRLEKKRPRKTQSKEFLGLQKEFKKLMQLKEFEKAEEVQKLMNKCEFQQMGLLNDRYESYCLFE